MSDWLCRVDSFMHPPPTPDVHGNCDSYRYRSSAFSGSIGSPQQGAHEHLLIIVCAGRRLYRRRRRHYPHSPFSRSPECDFRLPPECDSRLPPECDSRLELAPARASATPDSHAMQSATPDSRPSATSDRPSLPFFTADLLGKCVLSFPSS